MCHHECLVPSRGCKTSALSFHLSLIFPLTANINYLQQSVLNTMLEIFMQSLDLDSRCARWQLGPEGCGCEASFEGHGNWVNDVVLLGDVLVTCSNDRMLKLWKAASNGARICPLFHSIIFWLFLHSTILLTLKVCLCTPFMCKSLSFAYYVSSSS